MFAQSLRIPRHGLALARWGGLGVLVAHCVTSGWAAGPAPTWLNATDGNWTDPSNWSSSPYYPDNDNPTPGDAYAVLIDAAGNPYTVILNESVTVDSITVDSEDATLE